MCSMFLYLEAWWVSLTRWVKFTGQAHEERLRAEAEAHLNEGARPGMPSNTTQRQVP